MLNFVSCNLTVNYIIAGITSTLLQTLLSSHKLADYKNILASAELDTHFSFYDSIIYSWNIFLNSLLVFPTFKNQIKEFIKFKFLVFYNELIKLFPWQGRRCHHSGGSFRLSYVVDIYWLPSIRFVKGGAYLRPCQLLNTYWDNESKSPSANKS